VCPTHDTRPPLTATLARSLAATAPQQGPVDATIRTLSFSPPVGKDKQVVPAGQQSGAAPTAASASVAARADDDNDADDIDESTGDGDDDDDDAARDTHDDDDDTHDDDDDDEDDEDDDMDVDRSSSPTPSTPSASQAPSTPKSAAASTGAGAASASGDAAAQQAKKAASKAYCDWSKHTHTSGGEYYFNRVTKESTWDEPSECVASLPFLLCCVPFFSFSCALE
jgi:hypothetical protein